MNVRNRESQNQQTSWQVSFIRGSEEMHVEEYVHWARGEIVDAKYNMVEQVDLAWGREIHLGFYLHKEPTEGNDMDDQPTPIVEVP